MPLYCALKFPLLAVALIDPKLIEPLPGEAATGPAVELEGEPF